MKRIVLPAVAAVLLGSCTGTEKRPSTTESLESLLASRLEQAKTWDDTVIAVNGTFMGGFFNYNLHTDPELSRNLNMKDVERGIRQVMSADTTNMSYLYGIQVGMTIMNTYREVSADMPLDKTRLMESIMGALRLDSIDREQLLEIRKEFEKIDQEVKDRHQEELNQHVYAGREAQENRLFAEAIAAKLQSSPDYVQIGDTGIYRKIEREGQGKVYGADSRLRASYTVVRLSGEPIENVRSKAMFAGHAANPMLSAVLKYMKPGEKSQFFVPYEHAYGIQGNAEAGIGPCESLMVLVETE
ncbi:MAG: hypothetical protein K2F96_07105 [Muribaculaceae bacterium]|nr:hypothetical protein [Muribaculaceae bacterium]